MSCLVIEESSPFSNRANSSNNVRCWDVIFLVFYIVRQHGIGFGNSSELFFLIWRVVSAGLILERELPVGLFDLVATGRPVHSQDFIGVTFCLVGWHDCFCK